MLLLLGSKHTFAQWQTQSTGIEYNAGNVSTTGTVFMGTELNLKGAIQPRFVHTMRVYNGLPGPNTPIMTINTTTTSPIHPYCRTTSIGILCGTSGLGTTVDRSFVLPPAQIVQSFTGLRLHHTAGKEITITPNGEIRFWNGAILNPNAPGIQGPQGVQGIQGLQGSSPWVLDGINMRFSTGKVWIGRRRPTTGIHSNYKLAVDGKIISNEIFTLPTADAAWADDVFDADYKLPTLAETESYIEKNNRLPGIPTTEEIKTNGIDIGTMDAKLLRKVEELYLHVIRLDKENKELKALIRK